MNPSATLLELRPGIFQLSTGDQNGYLIDLGSGSKADEATWVWIDPGPREAVEELVAASADLLGKDLARLGLLVASHLDSTSLGALPELCRKAPKTKILMTQETWNFASLTGIPEARVAIAERFRNGFRLPQAGHGLEILLTPYAQYTAAFLLYESRSGSLFSADFLAGKRDRGRASAWADDCDWPQVAAFQMRHMPCSAALAWSLERIAALPKLEFLCPHHGGMLRGDVLRRFLTRLRTLKVGADLLESPSDERKSASSMADLTFAGQPSCPPPTS